MKEKEVMIVTRMPESFKQAFQEYCRERGLVQAWVVKKALEEYMKKHRRTP